MRYEPLTAATLPEFPSFGGELRRWRHHAALALMVVAVGLTATLAAIGLTVHNQQIEQHRVALTEAFLRLYGQSPVSESWLRLSEVWRAHEAELEPLLERVNEASGADLAQRALEWDYAVNRIVAEERLEHDIDVMLRFFQAVGRCVGVEHCDRAMSAAYFGRDSWAFRNMHYPFLSMAYPAEDFDADFERVAPRQRAG